MLGQKTAYPYTAKITAYGNLRIVTISQHSRFDSYSSCRMQWKQALGGFRVYELKFMHLSGIKSASVNACKHFNVAVLP